VNSGKPGTAPCGHPGYHVTANYVTCGQGCDAVKKSEPSDGVPEVLELEPTTRPMCQKCGSINLAKWGKEFRSGGKDFWCCKDCGKSFHA